MAIVTARQTGAHVTDPAEVSAMLAPHGIVYERWDIEKLAGSPQPEDKTPQEHVLAVFSDEVERLCKERGYQTADVIALKPDTPNLDALLAKFDKEHTHTEDEVRFVVSGRGIFIIRGKDEQLYDVEVHPGDLLAVPEGTQHWFELCEDRQIQCIRLFSEMSGWVAHYVDSAE